MTQSAPANFLDSHYDPIPDIQAMQSINTAKPDWSGTIPHKAACIQHETICYRLIRARFTPRSRLDYLTQAEVTIAANPIASANFSRCSPKERL